MSAFRVFYISKIDFSSSRTNVYNIARTCEAVNKIGRVRMSLVSVNGCENVPEFFKRHAVTDSFPVINIRSENLPHPETGGVPRLIFWLLRVNFSLILFLFRQRNNFEAIYLRDEQLFVAAWVAKLMGKRMYYEVHSVLLGRHRQMMNSLLVRFTDGLITISIRLKRYYGRLNHNSITSYCGADESFWVDYDADKDSLRDELALPRSSFLVSYAGVLGENPNGDRYEIDLVVEALLSLPKNVRLVVIGERDMDGEWLRETALKYGVSERLLVLPWQSREVVPNYLRASDIVVVPRRRKDLASDSPLKMFTALSIGRPIVSGLSESNTEILHNGENALVVAENSARSYGLAIKKIMSDPVFAQKLADKALSDSKNYTWGRRGKEISDFIARGTKNT